jgi:signal transduction histidine kinase
LHDTLLQSFQGLLLRFQSVSDLLLTRPEDAKRRLDGAIDYAAKAITEGRDAVLQLRSTTIVTIDLASAISMLAGELGIDHKQGTAPEFSMQVEGITRDLHPIVRDELYRIAAEALRNAFKHSGAKRIEVEIRYGERELRLRTRDNGRGIDPAILAQDRPAGHWGLSGMRERAKLLSAKFEVWSEVDSGTEVELIIPAAVVYTERKAWYHRLASVFRKAA